MLSVFARASYDEMERVLDSIEECRIALLDERKSLFERYTAELREVWELNQRRIMKKSRCIPYMSLMINWIFSFLVRLVILALAVFFFSFLRDTASSREVARNISVFLLLVGLVVSLIALCCGIIRAICSSVVKRMIAVQYILEEDYNLSSGHSADVNYYAVVKMALGEFLVTSWEDRNMIADRLRHTGEDEDDEIMKLGESLDSFFDTGANEDEDDVSE